MTLVLQCLESNCRHQERQNTEYLHFSGECPSCGEVNRTAEITKGAEQ